MSVPTSIGRPTWATVSLANLRHNYRQILSTLPAGQKIWGIVKANAYGHGLVDVSRALTQEGCEYLAVATAEEGIKLRQSSLAQNIYVLDGLMGSDPATYVEHRLVPVLHTLNELKQAIDLGRAHNQFLSVCLKFDTGMGRLGLFEHELEQVLKWLKVAPLQVDTVLTHLARADEDTVFTKAPYEQFARIRKQFVEAGLSLAKFSICNSAAVLDQKFESYDFVRPGLALYGAYPHERQKSALDLKPVLSLATRIISLKDFLPGSSIGYGGTFSVQRPSKIAMLPIGYADGYPRILSSTGFVLVRGERVPVVGRVSMDLMAVDVTDVLGVSLYDEVTLVGSSGSSEIRVEEVAEWAQTISYEILTGIQERVPRIYV